MTTAAGVHSFAYDRITGKLSDDKIAAEGITGGIGIAFHNHDMYLTVFDDNYTDSIMKLTDDDGNGVWGETGKGEVSVKIVKHIPIGDHDVDQLIVRGDTLFVGIGRRTIAGRRDFWTMGSHSDPNPNDPFPGGFWSSGDGFSWGDGALNGTICWIKDLTTVKNQEDSANPYGPGVTQDMNFYQQNDSPYTSNRKDALVVHSAGARNPYGLCLDKNGDLWFTNNFNRTETSGNGQANDSTHGTPGQGGDWLQPDFSKAVHDQLFHAAAGADYGYHDTNWRGQSPFLPVNIVNNHRVYSTTFDNLFNKGPYVAEDPANPIGLGPNSSPDGCSFFYNDQLPIELRGNIFIARYNPAQNDGHGQSPDYEDVVAVDTKTGKVRRVAQSFNQPLCVLWDQGQRLLIGDYGDGNIYSLRPGIHRLSVLANLQKTAGGINAVINITDPGDFHETGVTITKVTLGINKPQSGLPAVLGAIPAGGTSNTVTLFFPGNVTTGTLLLLTINGSYNGGTFASTLRVAAP
jgi:glucose/arabinose dehydrogenase